jgi:hypothetical protein
VRSISLIPNAATILLLSLRMLNCSLACGAKQQVCVVGADDSIGIEDYSEAIRRHVQDEGALASQS